MRLVSLKKRVEKLVSSISADFWADYQEWLADLTEKQAAKFWLHCYHFAYERKLLPLIVKSERDTEESLDIDFWNGSGQELFLGACEKEHKPANKYCSFCNIKQEVKALLEKGFEQEQQGDIEGTKQGLLPRY